MHPQKYFTLNFFINEIFSVEKYPNYGMYIYIYIYIYKKNFAWEDQRRKQCYIVHIAPQDVNSAILFVYRTGYMYGKEPGGFQKVFLSPFSIK